MNEHESQDDTHLIKGVYKKPSSIYEGKKKEFQPWHKPRKQYIRKSQWDKETKELIGMIDFRDNRPLKYLGLPGDDMFDIRALSKICLENNLLLKYLGFNSTSNNTRSSELTISENEMINISNVHMDSKTIVDFIQRVANKESKAYASMINMGPFDIINLDLCTSVAQMAEAHNTGDYRHFDAIYRILNYQTKTRLQPWLLFLTTRGDKACVNQEDLEKLWTCLQTNLKTNNNFREKLETLMGCSLSDCQSLDDVELEVYKFVQLFSVGVGKWLLKTMMSAEPKCSVKMLDSYCYRVSHSKPNLISSAFLFCPITRAPTNVSNLAERIPVETTVFIDINELECSLVDTVANITDVDELLQQNTDVQIQMIAESKALLKQARYIINGFDEWEQRNRPNIA